MRKDWLASVSNAAGRQHVQCRINFRTGNSYLTRRRQCPVGIRAPIIAFFAPKIAFFAPQIAFFAPQIAFFGPQIAFFAPQIVFFGPNFAI